MRTYSFTLAGARLAYRLTITRVDETVIRVTNYNKPITIDGNTWVPAPGLNIGDITETNRGDVPNLSFKIAISALFTKADIKNGLFERAEAVLKLTDARNPTDSDLDIEFVGLMKGDVTFDLSGNAQFEILNKFGLQRDIFVRKYTIEDDVDFGDPRRSKIPTFPTVDATSDDLADLARNETLAVGERRRIRYDTDDNPSDYHDVYLEVTSITTGVTGAVAPVAPSDTPGDTIVDGGVTLTVRNAYARAFQVASIINPTHITITFDEPRAVGVTKWFAPGMIVMRSGYLKNRASLVDAWDGISQISMESPFGSLLQVGDWGEIARDYDQTLDMAIDEYGVPLGILADGGANNYRGFPHLAGTRLNSSTFIPGVIIDFPDDDPGGGGGGGGGGGYEASWVEFESGST